MSEPKKSFRNTAWCPLIIVGGIVAFGAYIGDGKTQDYIAEKTARSMMAVYSMAGDGVSKQQVEEWWWQCAGALEPHSRYPEIVEDICVFKRGQ